LFPVPFSRIFAYHRRDKNQFFDSLLIGRNMPVWFSLLGRLEGTSLIALLLFVPAKYYAAWPLGVKILGPLHGGLFLAYCAATLLVGVNYDWSFKKQALAFLAAILPFGTFMFERKYSNANKENLTQV
jgi:integral membrane protein